MRPKLESFLPGFNAKTSGISHGGDHTKGKRKCRRPLDPKQALHVVMRSSVARGAHSMLHPKHCNHIERFTRELAERWGVRLYRYANVGNHIHLLVKVPSRAIWQRFMRELAGGIAIIVIAAKKGSCPKPNDSGRGFWDHLVFTRIVHVLHDRGEAELSKRVLRDLLELIAVRTARAQDLDVHRAMFPSGRRREMLASRAAPKITALQGLVLLQQASRVGESNRPTALPYGP